MASFDPIEIVSFCIIIASIIIVSPHWLILWQKHKKEKLLKENFNVPHINKPLMPASRLQTELPPVPSCPTTPALNPIYGTKFAN